MTIYTISALRNGNFEKIKWLHKHHPLRLYNAIDELSRNGYIDIIKWFHNNNGNCTERAMDWAAENGHQNVVEWLHYNRDEGCTFRAMNLAAQNGYLKIVKFLNENRKEGCIARALDLATIYGHLEIVNYFYESNNNNNKIIKRARYWANEYNQDHIIKWCKNPQINTTLQSTKYQPKIVPLITQYSIDTYKININNINELARDGRLKEIKILHIQHPCSERWTTAVIDNAAIEGHYETVKFLLANRNEGYTEDAIEIAMYNGDLDIVELLNNYKEKCQKGYWNQYGVFIEGEFINKSDEYLSDYLTHLFDIGNLYKIQTIYDITNITNKNISIYYIFWAALNTNNIDLIEWLYNKTNQIANKEIQNLGINLDSDNIESLFKIQNSKNPKSKIFEFENGIWYYSDPIYNSFRYNKYTKQFEYCADEDFNEFMKAIQENFHSYLWITEKNLMTDISGNADFEPGYKNDFYLDNCLYKRNVCVCNDYYYDFDVFYLGVLYDTEEGGEEGVKKFYIEDMRLSGKDLHYIKLWTKDLDNWNIS